MVNWIQKLFCPNSEKIASLLQENVALKKEKIQQSVKNRELKLEIASLKPKGTATPDFIFDASLAKTMSGDELRAILVDAFSGTEIMLNDDEYQYTTLTEVQRWASFDPTNEIPFRKNIMDCDKFALTDMANFRSENNYQLGNATFGIARGDSPSGYHAWNIAYVEEGVIMCEPQNDLIWKWNDNKDYKPDFIYI